MQQVCVQGPSLCVQVNALVTIDHVQYGRCICMCWHKLNSLTFNL
jgi:hypothetical protein